MPTPTTANRSYPLPHPDNELDTDVQRLVSALEAIDGDVASLLISVSQAALASHGHVIGDVTGLQAALNDKAAAGHTHAINDLTDVDITGAPVGRPLTTQAGGVVGIGPDWATAIAGKLPLTGGTMTGDLVTTADILAGASSKGVIGRYGWAGNYNAAKVQGIWTIDDDYRVDLSANNFGNAFGLVYAYHAAGTGVGNKLPIAGWGHQILIANGGVPFIGFSMTHGHGWFAGQVGVGRLPGPENSLDIAGNLNADSITVAGGPLNAELLDGREGAEIDPRGQQTIWLPAGSMIPQQTNGAERHTEEAPSNNQVIDGLLFDPATNEFAQFFVQMPKSWDRGAVIAQFIWTHGGGGSAFVVRWAIQARAFSNSDPLDAAWSTAVVASDTGGTSGDCFISPETGAVTVAGSPGTEELVYFRVYRDAVNGSDTLDIDAKLIGVKIHYTLNAPTDS